MTRVVPRGFRGEPLPYCIKGGLVKWCSVRLADSADCVAILVPLHPFQGPGDVPWAGNAKGALGIFKVKVSHWARRAKREEVLMGNGVHGDREYVLGVRFTDST